MELDFELVFELKIKLDFELDFELVFELKIEFDLEINKWTIGNKFTRGEGEDKQTTKQKETNQPNKLSGFVARQQSIFFSLKSSQVNNNNNIYLYQRER